MAQYGFMGKPISGLAMLRCGRERREKVRGTSVRSALL